jgi:hypothetical protein
MTLEATTVGRVVAPAGMTATNQAAAASIIAVATRVQRRAATRAVTGHQRRRVSHMTATVTVVRRGRGIALGHHVIISHLRRAGDRFNCLMLVVRLFMFNTLRRCYGFYDLLKLNLFISSLLQTKSNQTNNTILL